MQGSCKEVILQMYVSEITESDTARALIKFLTADQPHPLQVLQTICCFASDTESLCCVKRP